MGTKSKCLFCGKVIQKESKGALPEYGVCKECRKEFSKIGINSMTITKRKEKGGYQNRKVSCLQKTEKK